MVCFGQTRCALVFDNKAVLNFYKSVKLIQKEYLTKHETQFLRGKNFIIVSGTYIPFIFRTCVRRIVSSRNPRSRSINSNELHAKICGMLLI